MRHFLLFNRRSFDLVLLIGSLYVANSFRRSIIVGTLFFLLMVLSQILVIGSNTVLYRCLTVVFFGISLTLAMGVSRGLARND